MSFFWVFESYIRCFGLSTQLEYFFPSAIPMLLWELAGTPLQGTVFLSKSFLFHLLLFPAPSCLLLHLWWRYVEWYASCLFIYSTTWFFAARCLLVLLIWSLQAVKKGDTIFIGQYLFTGSETTSVWLEVRQQWRNEFNYQVHAYWIWYLTYKIRYIRLSTGITCLKMRQK